MIHANYHSNPSKFYIKSLFISLTTTNFSFLEYLAYSAFGRRAHRIILAYAYSLVASVFFSSSIQSLLLFSRLQVLIFHFRPWPFPFVNISGVYSYVKLWSVTTFSYDFYQHCLVQRDTLIVKKVDSGSDLAHSLN